MSVMLVELLQASSSGTPPAAPTSPALSEYGASLVQVNWTDTSGGTKQTRVYRRLHAGGWTLVHNVPAGTVFYQTGDSAASGYTYGVSTYDATTGLESSIATAEDLPPNAPTGVTAYTYSGTKKGVSWTNTESLPVRCYRNSVLVTTQPTGTTAWDSGYTSGLLGVSHYNSSTGQESEIVTAGGA